MAENEKRSGNHPQPARLPKGPKRRLGGRRGGATRNAQLAKYIQLFQFGQIIASELDFERLFKTIIEQNCRLLNAERSSIFLIDERNEFLRAFVSIDLKRDEFKIRKHQGIAGQVFCTKIPMLINRPYECPLFNPEVDRKTGLITRNIISVPLISRSRDCIGTMQVLNKRDGEFTGEDKELITHMANYCAGALENSLLYEDVKANAIARGKAIDHLSHELKTPLAVISAAFDRISARIPPQLRKDLDGTIARGRRNVARLLDLQEKVNDILAGGGANVSERYGNAIAEIGDLLEELGESGDAVRPSCAAVLARLNTIHRGTAVDFQQIRLDHFLSELSARIKACIPDRRIDLRTEFEAGLTLRMDGGILNKTCSGLLKNAIENTPDNGLIQFTAREEGSGIVIEVQDHGTGISAENQKLIFHGFFHTQATALYASKRPYAFNAGGVGAGLLRIRKFSERFGFRIDFTSRRCRYLPSDSDLCPGDTSACRHIDEARGCIESGGSTFRLRFDRTGPQDRSASAGAP